MKQISFLCIVAVVAILSIQTVYASGIAPTGCAIVVNRTSETTLVAQSYTTDPDSGVKVDTACADVLRDMTTQIGDEVSPEKYEWNYLANIAIGESIGLPVDQVWSSPGPDGRVVVSPAFVFDYFRAWEWTDVSDGEDQTEDVTVEDESVDDSSEAVAEKRTLQMQLISVLRQLLSLLGL